MKRQLLLFITVVLACLLSACVQKEEDAVEAAQTTLLASVNGEILTQADFELSETWLPDFVRQVGAQDGLAVHRFGALIDLVLMAQEAKKANLLSDAQTSLLIKEAQAQIWLESLALDEVDLSEDKIRAEIEAHPEEYTRPERYTVSYALVHTDQTRQALSAALGLMNGAQMGYNVVDPPPLEDNPYTVEGMPQMVNTGGHPRTSKFFNFAFVNVVNEKTNESCRLGPFSAKDEMLFSCPKAIDALKTAKIGVPIPQNISCDDNWKAFAILEWREAAAPLEPEMATLHARQKLLEVAKRQKQQKAIDEVNAP